MSWEALREACLVCKACDLAIRRTHVVFGEGNPQAPLVLVGEGPGENEDLTGRPFVGRAGQMLDKALEANGLDRNMVFITNTVKCRACEWEGARARNRPPTTAEIDACRPWLVDQLARIKPQVVLCIGAPSAKNLIKPDFKITKERGLFFKSDYAKAAIATLHPAYILRQQRAGHDGGYELLVADIAKAWDTATKLAERNQMAKEVPQSATQPTLPNV